MEEWVGIPVMFLPKDGMLAGSLFALLILPIYFINLGLLINSLATFPTLTTSITQKDTTTNPFSFQQIRFDCY
jgi:hypothetical protein